MVVCFIGVGPDSKVVVWVIGTFGKPDYIVEEVDEWHIQPGNTIEAHSLLTITKWPEEETPMLVKFPYQDARIETATFDGSNIPWSMGAKGKAELDLAGVNFEGSNLPVRIVWTLPLASLEPAGSGFRTVLRSLAPSTDFSLTVVLEAGCGYQIIDAYKKHPDQREITCFSQENKSPAHSGRGSCSLGIRKSAQVE